MRKILPQISEKSLDLTKRNQYTFNADINVNKSEIKKFLKKKYGVDVLSIQSLIIQGKRKRMRLNAKSQNRYGKRKNKKKFIIMVKSSQKIKDFALEEKPSTEKVENENKKI